MGLNGNFLFFMLDLNILPQLEGLEFCLWVREKVRWLEKTFLIFRFFVLLDKLQMRKNQMEN